MLFVWGKKQVNRKLGYVADFCPLCRSVKPFQVDRVGLASHLYYIPFGKGKLVGHARRCLDCKTVLNADPGQYREVSRKLADTAELQRTTFPSLQTHYAERLAMEQRIRHAAGSLPEETRRAMIREPFILLAPAVEKRFKATQIDGQTSLTLLAAAVLLPLLLTLGRKIAPAQEGEITLALFGLAVAAVVLQGFLQKGRYFERRIFPVLVPALKPLRPTEQEITTVVTELRKADRKFGRKLKLSALLDRLKR